MGLYNDANLVYQQAMRRFDALSSIPSRVPIYLPDEIICIILRFAQNVHAGGVCRQWRRVMP